MKILVNGYVGKKITGIGRTLIELLKRMDDGETKFVIYSNFDNEELIALESKYISVKRIRISKNSVLLNLLYNTFIFPFMAIGRSYTLVYISNFMPIFFKFKPTVVVIHDLIEFNVKDKFSKLRMLYRKMIVPTMAKNSNKIITVSNYSKTDIIKFFSTPESKIEVVYNSFFKKEDIADQGNNDVMLFEKFKLSSKKYFIYVGTIDYPGKNIHSVIKGFEFFKSKYKDDTFQLVLCGMQGKGADVIMDLISNSIYKKEIRYLGFVSDTELDFLYRNATLTAFMSFYEGFGLPIIESMKYGIPVITSNRSCLPEIAGEGGFIVDADDHERVGEVMYEIVTMKDKSEILLKMKKNLARFSWDKSANQTINVFRAFQ